MSPTTMHQMVLTCNTTRDHAIDEKLYEHVDRTTCKSLGSNTAKGHISNSAGVSLIEQHH
jgi:hypothetical protein